MKAAQLVEGKTYEDKKGNKRTIRQITNSTSAHTPNQVYYLEGSWIVNIPKQEFAAWAKRCIS